MEKGRSLQLTHKKEPRPRSGLGMRRVEASREFETLPSPLARRGCHRALGRGLGELQDRADLHAGHVVPDGRFVQLVDLLNAVGLAVQAQRNRVQAVVGLNLVLRFRVKEGLSSGRRRRGLCGDFRERDRLAGL